MAETQEQAAARIAREEATWTGPRFMGLMALTLSVAIAIIFTIASVPTKSRPFWDFSWYPFGKTPSADDLKPSSVSGLVR